MDLEYGKWCTVSGQRYMIVDWTKWTVIVHTSDGRKTFDKSVVTEVTDFLNPNS